MLRFNILTIFPEIFSGFLSASLIGKAVERGLLSLALHDIRSFADPPHFQVDDTPYGGGAGMVMKPEPIVRAVAAVKAESPSTHVIVLSASGKLFDQARAVELSMKENLTLICGRYEGIDQRAIELCQAEEISIGNYVMMGGEVAAMAVIEAVSRLRADLIGNEQSLKEESFAVSAGAQVLVEAPQYTRPAEFQGMSVPPALLSGNHKEIARWRENAAQTRTTNMRPDLMKK